MSKVCLLMVVSLVIYNTLFCQNYQAMYSNRTLFLEDDYSRIKAVKIDSVKATEDSILYPMRTIRAIDFGCYSPYAPTWFGEKVIIKPDGYNLFFNQNNDTIIINTLANLGEKWLAYELPDSLMIYAEITAKDTVNALGITDSLKTISFKAYDKMMNPVTHEVNTKTISLAKNFGIIETFDFFRFPDFKQYDYNEQENFKLIGMTNPDLGIQNLTWKQVYDFDVGDELHELYETEDWGGNTFNHQYITKKTINKIISKEIKGDTIHYSIDMRQIKITNHDGNYTYKLFYDTLNKFYYSDSYFDEIPGKPVGVENGYAYVYRMDKYNVVRKEKISPSGYETIIGMSDNTCWYLISCDDCIPTEYNYIEGLGGPYYSYRNFPDQYDKVENQLVYYKKGGEESGTPLTISEIEEKPEELEFKIFPNPAKEFVYITTSSEFLPYTFELFDITGKRLLTTDIHDSVFKLNTGFYKSGMYIYRLIIKDKIFKTGKLAVEF